MAKRTFRPGGRGVDKRMTHHPDKQRALDLAASLKRLTGTGADVYRPRTNDPDGVKRINKIAREFTHTTHVAEAWRRIYRLTTSTDDVAVLLMKQWKRAASTRASKPRPARYSVRTVSGGLPTLAKRR